MECGGGGQTILYPHPTPPSNGGMTHDPLSLHHRYGKEDYRIPTTGRGVGKGLVYWDLTPQQQPESYQGGNDDDDDDDDDDEMSVSLVEETGIPGGNHRTSASD